MNSNSTRENPDGDTRQVIEGVIELWADVCHVCGKASMASLKPYVAKSLAEPGSSVHRLIEAAPAQQKDFFASYTRQPTELRLRLIHQVLADEVFRQALDIFRKGMANMGVMNRRLGITFAEAERRIGRSFEHELSNVTLGELLGRLREPPEKIDVHTLLCNLGLSPGSVAGANKRLRGVLTQRMKTFSGGVPYYEQDLKVALWDCSKNQQLAYEVGNVLEQQGEPLKQIQILLRMAQRQERKLVRSILLKVLRKTIEELPDIHQEVKGAKQGEREVPLTEEMLAALPAPQPENLQDDMLNRLIDMLIQRGVDVTHLETKDFDLLAQELERMKNGKTRREYYGPSKNKMKERFLRLSDKLKTQAQ